MVKHIAKRILVTIPVLLGIVLLIFFMLNVVPGDPVTVMMKEHLKVEVVEGLRESMHLNDPFFVRYFRYIWDALHGDLGTSWKLSRSVTGLITTAFPYTLRLAIASALFSWIMGIPVGIISAVKKNSLVDHVSMGISLFGVSMPVFWIALILQNTFKSVLPVSGADRWQCYILPTIVLGWSSAGRIARLTRSSLLEVLRNDYIRTARSKGLSPLKVITRHALKNALIPVITVMAIQISSLLSGAVITESVFSIPGVGSLAVSAINNRDMPLLQGTVIFTAVLIIAGNLVADVLYSVIDPRIRVD
ncbi:MAG: ABC transporter permease [Clostridia bacterium]|nr:ABC transporter permease [Clostridia bacterium]